MHIFKFLLSIGVLFFTGSCNSLYRHIKKKYVRETINLDKGYSKSFLESQKYQYYNIPSIKREFRGLWVPTAANISWPSSNDLSIDEQKKEILDLISLAVKNKYNAIILQVRPSADAFYKSNYENPSYFLSKHLIKNMSYDPLAFWIHNCHINNIELHAWINPYRFHHSSGGDITKRPLFLQFKDKILKLKNGMYWFDPGDNQIKQHLLNVISDIVSNYDIDGIHMDDYFYPYPQYNAGVDIEEKSWYNFNNYFNVSKEDWRRKNVNDIIININKLVKRIKPYVKFGVSPFGIWKNNVPKGIIGLSQYDNLFSDSKLWLNKGWLDYISPQLYWPIKSDKQNFVKLLEWWIKENKKNIYLWPGLNLVGIKVDDKAKEILNQIKISNNMGCGGNIIWNINGIKTNEIFNNNIVNNFYKDIALVPKTLNKNNNFYKISPNIQIIEKPNNISLINNYKDNVYKIIVYKKYLNNKCLVNIYYANNKIDIDRYKDNYKIEYIAIKYLDRFGYESKLAIYSFI